MEDNPWFRAWNKVYNKLIDIASVPSGGSAAHIWLDSGEKKITVEELEAVGWEIVNRFPPQGDTTYCNLALAHAAAKYGCFDFRGLMANDIVAGLSSGTFPRWQLCSYPGAISHALSGGLGFVGKAYTGHGHVALIAPRQGQQSASWAVLSPIVFNVGKRNGLMKASEAFPVKQGMPSAWIYA